MGCADLDLDYERGLLPFEVNCGDCGIWEHVYQDRVFIKFDAKAMIVAVKEDKNINEAVLREWEYQSREEERLSHKSRSSERQMCR